VVRDRNCFDKIEYPNVYRGHNYALDIIENKIVSCKYIKGACNRYVSDIEKGIYPFDADIAEKFLRLAQKFSHIKGEWSNPLVVYEPWQCWVFMNIYGFQDPRTGFRRFRTAYLEVARGNGKSVLASISGLYSLSLDNPKGNEVSCFATTSNQARIVLDSSRAMARGNKSFLKATGTEVLAHCIKHDRSNSIMRARSSDHGSLDGLNDALSIIDELHAVSQSLYDVVVSGLKKRRDSLLLCITTAGFDVDGVGYAQSQYAKRVALGELEDDQTFSAVYTIDEGDDIFDSSNWIKANPNFGISVDPIAFEATARKARELQSELDNFKTKNLNVWLS
jgi:phage terminase large subunit-like protein